MIFFALVFGLVVGSFLNAAVIRAHTGQSLATGRSACPHCHHLLAPMDLVPVFSFLLLRGRCRYCAKPISWQYPLVEVITAATFVLLAHNFEFIIYNLSFWFQLVFASIFIFIAVFDFRYYLILDKVVYPSMALAIIYRLVIGVSLGDGLLGAALLGGFFFLQYLISRGTWIGWGDVKLGVLMGLILGWQLGLTALMLAYVSGALVGVSLLVMGKKNWGSRMPFGVFLGFSAIIIMLYGETMVDAYLKLIGYR